ncbi:MAG: protein-L-isoaspartate(D-aspartate) O-methyltransferase [Chitinophagaceae bacterium]|nr:MAG: protein-L-isoaspartate(D-aspartate) O-methyltransferase [Chitinophagaceae bacterium]
MKSAKVFNDSFQHKGMRRKLIETLREKGITDEKVLEAMNAIPRHFFLDSAFDKIAYEDQAFPIGADQTISHPYTVAYQTQLLQVKRGEKILEIGTGSIYQTTILAEMGAQMVYTIERQKKLTDLQENYYFKNKYLNIKFFYRDGFLGLPTYAPFDKILITAAAPFIPPKLVEQLKPGGLMVLPVDEGENQRMIRITKAMDGSIQEETFDAFSFVPMLGGKNI